jgi:hypothetical protein
MERETTNGKKFVNEITVVKGFPERPMTFEEVANKFRHSLEYNLSPIRPGEIEKTISMIEELDKIKDIRDLARRLV